MLKCIGACIYLMKFVIENLTETPWKVFKKFFPSFPFFKVHCNEMKFAISLKGTTHISRLHNDLKTYVVIVTFSIIKSALQLECNLVTVRLTFLSTLSMELGNISSRENYYK